MTGGATADANGVVALRLKIEESVEGNHAVDVGQWSSGFGGDVTKRIEREVLVRMMFLHCLKNAQQCAGAIILFADDLIDKSLFLEIKAFLYHSGHRSPFVVRRGGRGRTLMREGRG